MAQRRRSTSTRNPSTRTRRSAAQKGGGLPTPHLPKTGISPAVARSLLGLAFLVLGAILTVAMALPGEGRLTDYVRNIVVPFFGSARYLLPFALLVAGWYLEWGPGRHPEAPWFRTLLGIVIAYIGFLGLVQAMAGSGGRIGNLLYSVLQPLLTTPGAIVVLIAITIAGLLIAFDQPLHALLSPATNAAKAAGASLSRAGTPAADANLQPTIRHGAQPQLGPGSANGDDAGGVRRGRAPRMAPGEAPGQTGAFGSEPADLLGPPPQVQMPTSATIAPLRAPGAAVVAPRPESRPEPMNGDAGDVLSSRPEVVWTLPPHDLLDPGETPTPDAGANQDAVHAWNEAKIVEKLRSFDIEARITGRNAGPVVTQYEVTPAAHIKVSRIEALSDDLAMALAARSIRIEAPIPGKSAVGIEIPNKEFNIVALRRILEEVDFQGSGSRLTFALGRDVAGKAMAVDLARMPHLLIAGATGSGKSVMVNALITSLLCNAKPDEVRMILMDLKRVELAGYNGLPHLYVPVITEPDRAKAALKWAVTEMESRYRKFAGAAARNI
ncbi:MAG TPA: DNA translocase FtsK 4TM domain-containing protein, partial [Candidatus Limnocylindrales bacterium]